MSTTRAAAAAEAASGPPTEAEEGYATPTPQCEQQVVAKARQTTTRPRPTTTRALRPRWFLYTGQPPSDVPWDVVHVRVAPSVREVGPWAFYQREHLAEVDLPEGLVGIRECAFYGCHALKRVSVPSSVETIGVQAFCDCTQLTEVVFREGLKEIANSAFQNCKSLAEVSIPSTVKTVGAHAFRECVKLGKVHLHEGLVFIEECAFACCKPLRCIKIPSSVEDIGREAFLDCTQLLSVELCETHGHRLMITIHQSAFRFCSSLRNIMIPANALTTPDCVFEGCYDLMRLFGTSKGLDAMLRERMSGLPIHRLCYFNSYSPTRVAQRLVELKRELWERRRSTELNMLERNRTDSFWMTPLHVLACSTQQDLRLYQLLVPGNSEFLVAKDGWDCTPLLYAIWNEVPNEIVQFLIDSQKEAFPDATVDWDAMVETLCRAGAPLEPLKLLLQIHQESFLDQDIDKESCVREMALRCLVRREHTENWASFTDAFTEDWNATMSAFGLAHMQQPPPHGPLLPLPQLNLDDSDVEWKLLCEGYVAPLSGWWRPDGLLSSLKTLQFLVKCRVAERYKAIGIKRWRLGFRGLVVRMSELDTVHLETHYATILSRLHTYEVEYRELKGISSCIELALWKHRIADAGDALPEDTRQQLRFTCGSDVIVPHVMQYIIREADQNVGPEVDTSIWRQWEDQYCADDDADDNSEMSE